MQLRACLQKSMFDEGLLSKCACRRWQGPHVLSSSALLLKAALMSGGRAVQSV